MRALVAALLLAALAPAPGLADEKLRAFEAASRRYAEAVEQGRLAEATSAAEEAYELARDLPTISDEQRGVLAGNLAYLYAKRHKRDAAIETYRQAIAHYESAHGPEAAALFEPVYALGIVYLKSAWPEGARETLRRVRKLVETHFDRPSAERARYYLLAARFCELERDTRKARGHYRQALSDYEAMDDPTPERVGLVYFLLGRLDLKMGRKRSAVGNLERALALYQSALPPHDDSVLRTRTFLVQTHLDLGDEDEAVSHVQEIARHRGDVDRENIEPLYRTVPAYPSQAARRGQEGWVRLRFTITREGRVEDPVVVSAEPEGVFEKAALAAIKRWWYAPKVTGGEFVEAESEVTLRFRLR